MIAAMVIFVHYNARVNYLNTEEGITETFNDNLELFLEAAAFIENDPGDYYCYKTPEKFLLQRDGNNINSCNIDIGAQILYLINDLKFIGILEYDDCICFIKQDGSDHRGIIYEKIDNCSNKYDGPGKVKLIINKWAYFDFLLT